MSFDRHGQGSNNVKRWCGSSGSGDGGGGGGTTCRRTILSQILRSQGSSGGKGKLFPNDGVHSIGRWAVRQATRHVIRLANIKTGEEERAQRRFARLCTATTPRLTFAFGGYQTLRALTSDSKRARPRMGVR